MSEERTQTNVEPLDDEPEDPPEEDERSSSSSSGYSSVEGVPARQHPLPWVLFGVAVVLLAVIGGLLARKASLETRRANDEREKSLTLQAQVAQLLKQQGEVEPKLSAADAKVKEAEGQNAELAAKVKKLEEDNAALQKQLETGKPAAADAGTTAKKPDPKKTTKKTTKKKRRR